jgi:hypothetical protein
MGSVPMTEPLHLVIAVLPRGSRAEIRVQLTEFKGRQYAEVRLFEEFTAVMGARSPTAKGVTIPFEMLPEFARAVVDAEVQARALGLIGGGA